MIEYIAAAIENIYLLVYGMLAAWAVLVVIFLVIGTEDWD